MGGCSHVIVGRTLLVCTRLNVFALLRSKINKLKALLLWFEGSRVATPGGGVRVARPGRQADVVW